MEKEPHKKTRTSKTEQILRVLQENSSLTLVAKALNRSKSATYERLRRLEKEGIVFQHNRRWHLTEQGTRTNDPLGSNSRTRKVMRRHHHIIVWFAHRESEQRWKSEFQGSMVQAYVGSVGWSLNFQFTRTGIQFSAKEPVSVNHDRDVARFHDKCLAVARFLERRFKIRLHRPADLGMRKLYSELAYLRTAWAEHEVEQKQRFLWLYGWEQDGKPRIGFDKSHLAEKELHGLTVDDDEVESLFFMKKLASGELRETFHKAEALDAYMPELMQFMNAFAVGMREHMVLITKLQGVADSLRTASHAIHRNEQGAIHPTEQGAIHPTEQGPVDRLFSDDVLREKFNAASRDEQDRMLGLK